jgi:hypothetical protein
VVVRLLAALAWVLLVLCAAAGIAWFVADRQATVWLARELDGLHLAGVVGADRASLPSPDTVLLQDATLRDEVTGEIVGRVERVELRLALPDLSGLASVRPLMLSGRGGSVLLSNDGDTLVFARAIEQLLDHIREAIEERRGPEPEPERERAPGERPFLPPMEFRDIELTLRSPGLPDHVIPGCDAFLELRPDDTFAVDIDVGGDGGHVLLEFGEGGLHRVHTRQLAVSPVMALFVPQARELLAEHVVPEGLLDLEARDFFEHHPRASGVLRHGTLRPPKVPFPLTEVTLPFELKDGHASVANASLAFDGGTAVASFDYGPDLLTWDLDVVDGDFRRDYLALLPEHLDLSWVSPDDGGNLELHLHVETPQGEGAEDKSSVLRGSGGILVRRLHLGPSHVEVEDMVSRFELRDKVLVFHEASGRCASGVVSVKGSVDVSTGDVDGRAQLFDVDIARVRRALDMDDGAKGIAAITGRTEGVAPLTGWLQGDVSYQGRIGDPRQATGRGQFSVRGGNLWRIPVLDAVLDALRLANPGSEERHRLTVVFDVVGRRYDIHVFKLESPFLSLVGDGKLNRDGTLEIDIVPIKVPLGYVGDLIEYIQSQVVRLELRGTLQDPKVSVVPVRAITKPVGRFWDWLGGLFSSKPEPVAPPFDPLPSLPEPAPEPAPEPTPEAAQTPPEPEPGK